MRRFLVLVLSLGWAVTPVFALEPQHARIDGVEGAKTVLLQKGLALRDAGPGEEILPGERIRTDAKTTVKVVYPDGSRLVVHPGSDLELTKPENGVQTNSLNSGLVQGQVPKPAHETYAEGARPVGHKPPIKFVIRTKTAVMGVRGTEFVAGFNAANGLAQFNTLEGAVEVATGPQQLLGGQGVSVASGQFVQATEGGLGSVGSFSVPNFVNGLGDFAKSMGSGGEDLPGSGSGSSAAEGAADVAAAEAKAPPPVPPAAPPPKMPQALPGPVPPPALVEKQKVEAEAEKPRLHLLAFSVGGLFAQNPNPNAFGENRQFKALELSWTPIFPIPVLNFLYVRGAFGATLFENFAFSKALLIRQFQAFAGLSLLTPLFIEAGGGEQIWRDEGMDSANLGINAGFMFGHNAKFNRIYAGVSRFFKGTQPLEVHLGVLFVIW